jgi:hypothetical protein
MAAGPEAPRGGWSDQKKWAFGILGAVTGSVLVWYLTHDGGLLNPKPDPRPTPRPAAQISISAFSLPFPLTQNNPNVDFTISNSGDEEARACTLRGDVTLGLGRQFSVDPHSSLKTHDWGVYTYGKHGNVTFRAWVVCANATSAVVTQSGLIVG